MEAQDGGLPLEFEERNRCRNHLQIVWVDRYERSESFDRKKSISELDFSPSTQNWMQSEPQAS
jgi:hypothetical protein